jgi:hypothetical protein
MAKNRFHRGRDGWGRDSYEIPRYAVAGCSYTGEWHDSPCPGATVVEERARFRREVLKPLGIKSRLKFTQSGNVFMQKAWTVVSEADFPAAASAAAAWFDENGNGPAGTRLIHDADLQDCKELWAEAQTA